MNIDGYGDIIIIAIIAIVIFIKLRSVLGKEDGTKERMQDKMRRAPQTAPTKDVMKNIKPAPKTYQEPETVDKSVENVIVAIKQRDQDFSAGFFIHAAKQAFEMVMKAYQEGDKETLEMLLDRSIYAEFNNAITSREAQEQQEHITLLSIPDCQLKTARLNGNIAEITVRIESEQIRVFKDKDGKIVDGDPSLVETITDEWVFARDLNRKDPTWNIIDT